MTEKIEKLQSKNLDKDRVSDNYILVTPIKDEEKNLPGLIESIKNQTVRPSLWVIVNDGSTDNSPVIIRKAAKKMHWIKVIDLNNEKRDIGLRYSYVCKKGFDYATKYSKEYNISYKYIGLIDGDIIVEKDYFKKLILEFKKDPKLGIGSGILYSYSKKGYQLEKTKGNYYGTYPAGACRLWRKECFEDTGGYSLTYAPDTVSNIKALLRGWKIKRFKHIVAKQVRGTGTAEGLRSYYIKKGIAHYYLYQPPSVVISRFIKYMLRGNFYGSYYIYGYINAWKNKMKRTTDEEIIKYFKNKSLLDYIKEELSGDHGEKS